ncbi:LOW QUALITY PROTEIN: U3 small nucleolar RNA-interacting protein 2 [Anomaloglossus baeobatrachus]
MSGLFIKKRPEGPGKKRRGEVKNAEDKKKKIKVNLREEIESDSDTEIAPTRRKEDNEEEELEETPQEKKLRLAKEYLRQLQEQEEERLEDPSEDLIAHRLQENVLEQRGKLQRPLAKELLPPEPAEIRFLRVQGPVTCLVITPDDKHVFSGSKDCAIIKWSISDGKKVHNPGGRKGCEEQHIGHTAHILCMALSSDGKYLVSSWGCIGDANKLIYIWNAETCQRLHKFQGHRGPVSGLSFQKGTYQLFSASHDRSVKVWNVAENAYIETLFGHQDSITGLDSLSRERCVTSGGRDGTVRVWKNEETQLVFSGHDGSIDCIRHNEEHMVSGADDGSLALNVAKKKPLARRRCSHGSHGEAGLEQPYWVSSVAAALNSDVVASGSHDGNVRIWQCGENFRGLQPLCTIPLVGFVNSLQFSSSADFLIAGVGQEHRLGRWWRLKPAKNGLYIMPFRRKTPLAEGS